VDGFQFLFTELEADIRRTLPPTFQSISIPLILSRCDAHGKEALNFQISMLIYNAAAAIFCLVLIGFVFLAILWVLNAVFVIIASIQASDGKFYSYPMTIHFIQ
jgi:uncharacterized Tic20 family protein